MYLEKVGKDHVVKIGGMLQEKEEDRISRKDNKEDNSQENPYELIIIND